MRSWRHLIVALLVAWLPFQGWAAAAMPFCPRHGMEIPDAATATPAHEHAQSTQGMLEHCGVHLPGPQQRRDSGCNGCSTCEFACSPSVPAHAVILEAGPAPQDYPPELLLSSYRFYPELPSRPPLAALA